MNDTSIPDAFVTYSAPEFLMQCGGAFSANISKIMLTKKQLSPCSSKNLGQATF